MSNRSSPLGAVSIGYVESLYETFRTDPDRLDESWRCLFGVLDLVGDTTGMDVLAELAARRVEVAPDDRVAELFRSRGHLLAGLNPLVPDAQDLAAIASHASRPALAPDAMAARYAGTLAVETAHIDDPTLRNWLVERWETGDDQTTAEAQRAALEGLLRADEFERFLGRKFPTKKRFGVEGAEAVVPLLRHVLRHAAAAGVTHVVVGTMHRGRLNILANVFGRPLAQLLAEIKGAHPFPNDAARPADVPYHLGHRGSVDTGAGVVDVTLLANPSHLEAVDPVVLGSARAVQERVGQAASVLPVILHTDAAVIAQGVVAEMLQLASAPGFTVGGTLHVVVNNQIGFTTDLADARASTHCTGAWKAVDSCILHANGDDVAAVMRAAAIGVDWRQAHGRDAVIDLVCYRRNGHNEIDEPTFTQPVLYDRVGRHTPVAEATARALVAAGALSETDVEDIRARYRTALEAAFAESQHFRSNTSGYPVQGLRRAPSDTPTGVEPDRLRAVAQASATMPEWMTAHPKMDRLLRPQRNLGKAELAWPVAEALAFGTLLEDAVAVRLTGQDVVRGAFSHRHYSLSDMRTGRLHTPLASLGSAPFAVHNSPLSEYAVLGFEYGYSLERPNDLTIWEAQFGDFANGAQIILDQFLAAGEEKWCLASNIVVLLPHGLEGQGPEHSSARLERFLQMAAAGNMRIANPSTPANYFHLLRRQALVAERKPLVVMGAKRLLRLPAATSPLAAFGPGCAFEPVLTDAPGEEATRILLCSGKIAYDLLTERDARGASDVAVVRLEELYPFPAAALHRAFARWPAARCVYVQEEPRNMGAWSWLDRQVEQVRCDTGAATPRMSYVGRSEAGSPAGSFHGDHDDEQRRIVAAAFAA